MTSKNLTTIYEAIREGRAYLDTAFGKQLIVAYRDGWATTNNSGDWLDERSFLVCDDAILIAPRSIRTKRRVVKHYSFLFEGRQIPVTSSEIETTWEWPS